MSVERPSELREAAAHDGVVVGDEKSDHRGRQLQREGRAGAGARAYIELASRTGRLLLEQREADVAFRATALALAPV